MHPTPRSCANRDVAMMTTMRSRIVCEFCLYLDVYKIMANCERAYAKWVCDQTQISLLRWLDCTNHHIDDRRFAKLRLYWAATYRNTLPRTIILYVHIYAWSIGSLVFPHHITQHKLSYFTYRKQNTYISKRSVQMMPIALHIRLQ